MMIMAASWLQGQMKKQERDPLEELNDIFFKSQFRFRPKDNLKNAPKCVRSKEFDKQSISPLILCF